MKHVNKPKIIPGKEHGLLPNQINDRALSIINGLHEAGFQAYIVGGCVRDLLIGRQPKDFDVVTNALPKEIKQLFSNCRLIGRRFRLAHIYFGRRDIVEVATFRTIHHGDCTKEGMILCDNMYGTIDEDVYRRDFTVNALYYDPLANVILDFVDGFKDLRYHILRIIGEPEKRYREDPVRMLRATRFIGKLDLSPEKETVSTILKLNYLLENVSPSRLYDETIKLFQCGFAEKSFPAIEKCGIFKLLLPLTEKCFSKKGVREFTMSLFQSTDKRLSEKKPVVPSFLFATLLWYPLMDVVEENKKQDLPSFHAFNMAVTQVLKEQSCYTMLPRWVKMSIRDIWSLQYRLEKSGLKYTKKILEHKRFRAAYDLLVLRAQRDEQLKEIVNKWESLQQ